MRRPENLVRRALKTTAIMGTLALGAEGVIGDEALKNPQPAGNVLCSQASRTPAQSVSLHDLLENPSRFIGKEIKLSQITPSELNIGQDTMNLRIKTPTSGETVPIQGYGGSLSKGDWGIFLITPSNGVEQHMEEALSRSLSIFSVKGTVYKAQSGIMKGKEIFCGNAATKSPRPLII